MTAIRDLMFLLPILLLHAVEGSLGDEIDRTISEEEFHLSKDVVSFAQKKVRFDLPVANLVADVGNLISPSIT
jgi:hypothetical protein